MKNIIKISNNICQLLPCLRITGSKRKQFTWFFLHWKAHARKSLNHYLIFMLHENFLESLIICKNWCLSVCSGQLASWKNPHTKSSVILTVENAKLRLLFYSTVRVRLKLYCALKNTSISSYGEIFVLFNT